MLPDSERDVRSKVAGLATSTSTEPTPKPIGMWAYARGSRPAACVFWRERPRFGLLRYEGSSWIEATADALSSAAAGSAAPHGIRASSSPEGAIAVTKRARASRMR